MKKNNIILWIGSFIISFLAIYFSNLFSDEYPVSGTIGIEGKKVTYMFERVHYGKERVNTSIRTDINEIIGYLKWHIEGRGIIDSLELKRNELFLVGQLPPLNPEQKIEYYVDLIYKNKLYRLPTVDKVNLINYGKIPGPLNVLEYLLNYLIIILSVRIGLECLGNNKLVKKFGVILLIILLTLIALINPLYLTYKYGFMNHIIPPIGKLFNLYDLLTFFIWLGTLIHVFRSNSSKKIPIVTAFITVILFTFFR